MNWPWSKKTKTTVVVVDIRTSSISAGYVLLEKDKLPQLVYALHYPLASNATEPLTDALVRTLDTALAALIHTGSPHLASLGISTKSDEVLVTISSPWQTSTISSFKMVKDQPFTFTAGTLQEMTSRAVPNSVLRGSVDQLLLSTLLNGYETPHPFGRQAKSVEVVTLQTSVEQAIHEQILALVRKAFHHKHITVTAFLPELYSALKDILPIQRDYMVLDVSNESSDILLVKHGLIVSTVTQGTGIRSILDAVHSSGLSSHDIPVHEHDVIDHDRNASFQNTTAKAKDTWIAEIKQSLSTVAKEEPLPRQIYVVSEPAVADFVRRLLDSPELRSLWLSDDPLTLTLLTPDYFSSALQKGEGEVAPLPLCTLAVRAQKRCG